MVLPLGVSFSVLFLPCFERCEHFPQMIVQRTLGPERTEKVVFLMRLVVRVSDVRFDGFVPDNDIVCICKFLQFCKELGGVDYINDKHAKEEKGQGQKHTHFLHSNRDVRIKVS